jgi:predicted HAD superfamily phosphohydrolase
MFKKKFKKVSIMEIDIHGMRLWEAIDEIIYRLEESRLHEDEALKVIHGYRRGKVLKDYIQSEGFIREMKRAGYSLKKRGIRNRGATTFQIEGISK